MDATDLSGLDMAEVEHLDPPKTEPQVVVGTIKLPAAWLLADDES